MKQSQNLPQNWSIPKRHLYKAWRSSDFAYKIISNSEQRVFKKSLRFYVSMESVTKCNI